MVGDRDHTSTRDFDDTGTKDFWFGVIGLGAMALIAILIAIIS